MTGSSRAAAAAKSSESVAAASVTPISACSVPPHALRGGVGTQPDGGAEVTPGEPPVAPEQTEDLAVGGVHGNDYRSPWPNGLASRGTGRQKRAMDPNAALLAGLLAGLAIATRLAVLAIAANLALRG